MKFFLDTNIVLILFQGRYEELRALTLDILDNNSNSFYTSSISLLEIIQLYRKKKIEGVDYENNLFNTGEKFIDYILKKLPIVKVLPFDTKQALIAGRLTFVPNHKDPNDLSIIAHAISEEMPIITCDDKFPEYENQGIKVLHNSRQTKN
jgi:PIN domain